MSKILNIVFYEKDDTKEKRAKIFYKNNAIEDVDYDTAIEKCFEFAKDNNITTMDEFKKILNNELVYVKPEKEIEELIDTYTPEEEEIESIIDDDENNEISEEEIASNDEKDNYDVESNDIDDDEDEKIDISDEEYLNNINNKSNQDIKEEKEYKGVKGFFRKIKDKLIKNKIVKRIVLCVTALAVGLGIYSVVARKSLEGKMANSNLTTITTKDQPKNSGNKEDILIIGDNSYYDNYNYETLLSVTNNEEQKTAMNNNFEMLKDFNGRFALAYQEKDIKPALTFDEVSALQAAYNDYSKEKIKKIFNGAEVKSKDLDNYYKNASLQLMGAYIIETKENPVDVTYLINSKEGKDFYIKYHQLFLKAKYAEPDKQAEAVKEFYNEVRKDFPITKEIRTEGISHSDTRNSIEPYKLSVTPMIAAAEMIFQNLKVDNTLKDGEIDFINDIGLCNYAKETFNRIETILLVSENNKEEPLYEQYKNTIVKMMNDKRSYVIDDAHRDLSKLKVFQLAVNGHFNQVINGEFNCTKTVTSTFTETHTTYREEVTKKILPITAEGKREVDEKIARENAQAKAEGENQAERNRENMQNEEKEKAAKINSEVEKENQDMQKKVEQANKNINNGNSVNEKDFGNHNVDFDDDYSDENGNLDNSVKDITTDGNGADNGPLPDPNELGRKFDGAPVGASNEEIVDQIVESMSNTSYEEDAYQYTK